MSWHPGSGQWTAKRGKDIRTNGRPYPHIFYLGKDRDDALRKLALIEAKQLELKQKGISNWTEEALHQLQEQGATRLNKRRRQALQTLPKVHIDDVLKSPSASHLLDENGNIRPTCWEQVHQLIITELMRHPHNQQSFADALQEAYFKDPLGTIERLKRMATIPGGPNINLNIGERGGIGLNVFVQDEAIEAPVPGAKELGGTGDQTYST